MLYKMTEVSVGEITPVASELKGDSRLVVLLGSPEGIKGVSKKLSSILGIKKIRKGLFIIHGYSEIHETILQSQSVIFFIKTRKIPTLRMKMEDVFSNRVYSIVAFKYNNPTAQQKKRTERLIKKSTGIRLRPGVVLFPLLRSKEQRRFLGSEEERVLLNSNEFSKKIRENGGETIRWSRIKIINLDGINQIKQAVERAFTRDLIPLEEKIQHLRKLCKDSAVSVRDLKKNYTLLSRTFRDLKTKWTIAKKLWLYESDKSLKRVYNMLINTRRMIVAEENRRLR